MEGWNDCPLPMLSSTTSRPKKRVSRVVSSTTASSPRMIPTDSNGPPPARSQPTDNVQKSAPNVVSPETNLQNLASQGNFEQKNEKFLVEELVETLNSLDLQQKDFLNLILVAALEKKQFAVLKGQIVKYMMTNTGSAHWCTSLQRLVEVAYDDQAS